MQFITKKCPHCGAVYEKSQYATKTTRYGRSKYGSPLKICTVCNLKFIDNEYIEIEVDGAKPSDVRRISPSTVVYSCFLLFIGMSGMKSHFYFSAFLICMALIISLREILTYNSRMKKLYAEAEASKKRLQNPKYALELKKRGYDVPKEYLTLMNPHGKDSDVKSDKMNTEE